MKSKRTPYVLIVVLGAVLAGSWFVLRPLIKSAFQAITDQTAAIEEWCGKQILTIANDHLQPELHFNGLSYTAPGSLRVENVSLVDANAAGEDVSILTASALEIELAAVPVPGKPIVIERITCVNPVIRVVRTDDGTGFVGFSNLVDDSGGKVNEDGGSSKLSDVLAIRVLEVMNGAFEYDEGAEQTQRIDGLSFIMRGQPDQKSKGWYDLNINARRDHLMTIDLQGALNLDTTALQLDALSLITGIHKDSWSIFPPAIQTYMIQHDVQGDLRLDCSGSIATGEDGATELAAKLQLDKCGMTFDDIRLPVESLNAEVRLANDVVSIDSCDVKTLDGTVALTGTIKESGAGFADLVAKVTGVKIESLYLDHESPPRIAGTVDVQATISMMMASVQETIRGEGLITIKKGKLLHLPLIEDFIELLGALSGNKEAMNDAAKGTLTFLGDHVKVTDMKILSAAMAVRGNGRIGTDGMIDLEVNAGSIERAQEALGPIGEFFGKLTDKLVKYKVKGPLSQPEISVKPLGL